MITILSSLILAIRDINLRSGTEVYLLTEIIHDWLCHLCDESGYLEGFDISLSKLLCDRTLSDKETQEHWFKRIYLREADLTSLLYRGYLVDHGLDHSVTGTHHWKILDSMMSSMLYIDVRFSNLIEAPQLKSMHHDINTLRAKRLKIKKEFEDLMNSEDVSDYYLDRSHSRISSYALVYAISVIIAILEFQSKLSRDSEISSKLQILKLKTVDTLAELKGVLFNGQS